MLSSKEQVEYYIQNKKEFEGDDGYNKVLSNLSRVVPQVSGKALAIDVGGCIGDELDVLNSFLQENETKLLVFEPNPVNVKVLETNKNVYPNLILLELLVSNEDSPSGKLRSYKQFPENKEGYLLAGMRCDGDVLCERPVVKLDTILKLFPEEYTVKILKIDTEGNDTFVLEGCKDSLHRIQYIVFEASDCLDDFRGPGTTNPLESCIDMLDEKGFDVYRIGTRRLLKLNKPYWDPKYETLKFWSNCFACKRNDPTLAKILDSQGFYRF